MNVVGVADTNSSRQCSPHASPTYDVVELSSILWHDCDLDDNTPPVGAFGSETASTNHDGFT
jgi:hypothetical protein